MNLPKNFEKYPDEAICIKSFKVKLLEMGIVCKK